MTRRPPPSPDDLARWTRTAGVLNWAIVLILAFSFVLAIIRPVVTSAINALWP